MARSFLNLLDFSAVIRGSTIIASYGDLPGISEREILRLIPPQTSRVDQKIAFGKLFSFVTTPALVFLAISQHHIDKQRPLAFLDILSSRWTAGFGPTSAAAEGHGMDSVFASNYAGLFNEYSKTSKASEVAQELDETQKILAASATKALDRGSRLEGIHRKSESLKDTSDEFRAEAARMTWKMKCRYVRVWIWWIMLLLVIVYVILTFVCHGLAFRDCW